MIQSKKSIFFHVFFSMISRADQNDKWASYAGPGGWNGTKLYLFTI